MFLKKNLQRYLKIYLIFHKLSCMYCDQQFRHLKNFQLTARQDQAHLPTVKEYILYLRVHRLLD